MPRSIVVYALAALLALSTAGASSCDTSTYGTDTDSTPTDTYTYPETTTEETTTEETTTEETTTEETAPPTEPTGDCESGYEPCVPTYPPDLDCADIGHPVTVTGDDPHRLDADGDGAGCE